MPGYRLLFDKAYVVCPETSFTSEIHFGGKWAMLRIDKEKALADITRLWSRRVYQSKPPGTV
jgi:hypothetical protein